VVLDGLGSRDPNGLRLSYQWSDAQGKVIGTHALVWVRASLGTNLYNLTVSDSTGLSSSAQTSVTVRDLKPPILRVDASPRVLIPANDQFVPISASIIARDHCDCDAKVAISLVSIVSDDPAEDSNDIQGASYGADDRTFLLRARLTSNNGNRVYTITYRATDLSGNSSTASTTVSVPKGYGDMH
jgi:hypothetical protein